MPDIDVDEWRANTDLHNLSANSSTVTWFWRAVRSFDVGITFVLSLSSV
jgi:E3 ubiquitin-protein ligase HUWE1